MPTQPAILGPARLNNFRLNYVPSALNPLRATRVRILLDGVDVRVRVSAPSIQDVLNEQPNTCTLTIDGQPFGAVPPPTVGEDLRITLNADTPRVLFAGTLQAVDRAYDGRPEVVAFLSRAIDYTTRLNYRRPFGTWVDVSATTIAQAIVAAFAPAFSVTHIDAGLPAVTITFDGSEEFIACLGRLAALIGGYCKVDDMDVYLFNNAATPTPDGPIVTPTFGAGIVGGVHGWAYTWVTALGETTPSSVTSATLGVPTPPTFTPTVAVLIPGTGSTRYVYTFGGVAGNYADMAHESAPSPASAAVAGGAGASTRVTVAYVPVPGPPYVHLWRSTNGGPFRLCQFGSNFNTTGTLLLDDQDYDLGLTLPAPGIGGTLQASLSNIGVGPAGTLSRKLYRTVAGGAQLKLLATLANNTALTYLDTVADGSLGANAPTADTSGLGVQPDQPDPVDLAHPPLDDPAITVNLDDSQLRTRVYGKGHGESLLSDVVATETALPVADSIMFNPSGGRAIVSTTPDGATSIQLTYTGIQYALNGAMIGPGAVPSTAPFAIPALGTGLASGTYRYAYTDQTAIGESLPSPVAVAVVGAVADPVTYPTIGTLLPGAGPDAGLHQWAVTFTTSTGETLPGPRYAILTGNYMPSPGSSIGVANSTAQFATSNELNGWDVGDTVEWYYAYGDDTGPSNAGTPSVHVSVAAVANPYGYWFNSPTHPSPQAIVLTMRYTTDPRVTRLYVYYRINSGPWWLDQSQWLANHPEYGASLFTVTYSSPNYSSWQGAPTPTNPGTKVPLQNIPIGGASVIGRMIYRTTAGGSALRFLAFLGDNTTTTYTDGSPDSSLGAAAPVTNTAGGNINQVALSGIAIGQTGTTARRIYRTAVNGTQLKLLKTLADNTTTTSTDAAADGTLGANVPVGDTSGLKQAEGQVNAGSTTMPVASTVNFSAGGGWALLAGGQVVRFTGITPNALTGIPAAGPGAIFTTVLYGTPIITAPSIVGVSASGLPQSLADPTVAAVGGYTNAGEGPPYPFVSGDLARNWLYTFVSNSGETRPSPPSTLTLPLSGAGPWHGSVVVPVGPVGTVARRVYRTTAGGSAFKLAGTLANNTATTFNDHTADGALGAAPPGVNTAILGGVPVALKKGAAVNIFVQRDDLAAQAEAAVRESTDNFTSTGIHEHLIVDERRAEASLIELCDADLVLFARLIVTFVYATHDVKSRSGKTVHINMLGYPVGDYVIQNVTIDQIDVAAGTPPRFTVTASSVMFSLPDVLRRLISAQQAV